jgi:hypothetical protein
MGVYHSSLGALIEFNLKVLRDLASSLATIQGGVL